MVCSRTHIVWRTKGTVNQYPHGMSGVDVLPELSVLAEKVRRYREEVFFREAWLDLEAVAGERLRQLLNTHALILFKPDGLAAAAVEPALEILRGLRFRPVAGAVAQLDRHSTRWMWLYRFNVASVERVRLHDRINGAGPSLLVVLRDELAAPSGGVPATVRLTDCKGPSRPERRRPDQLRTRLGVDDRLLNFVHTSDEPADLVREIGILLAPPERRALAERILGPDSWERWFAARRPLLGLRPPAPEPERAGFWEAVRTAAGQIDFDEPGAATQTLGDAPPGEWMTAIEGGRR